MMAQGVPVKRQFQPINDADTIYRELSRPIRNHDTVSQPRLYQPVSDCDTVCPPKKRALFDYNREQARKITSAENGRIQFHLAENSDEYAKNQFNSNVSINRQAFFSNKLKLDRVEHDAEIRPRSDSLHSINSQFSEISSIDSINSSSLESSPVMGEDNLKFETRLRNSFVLVNGSDSDSLMHTEEISEITVRNDAEKKSFAKDHETPERNPMLVLNGIKSDIQKPLFTNSSPKSGDTDKSKPMISKTLFPLNQVDIQNFEQNVSQNKQYLSQNYIPNKNGESFQYSDIPNSENEKSGRASKKTLMCENYTTNNNAVFNNSENTNENSRGTETKKNIGKSSRILGDVTNSLNIDKKFVVNKSMLGTLINENNVKTSLMEQNENFQEFFTCSLCNEQFQQYEIFDNHMKLHEKRSKLCKCDLCDATFDNTNLRKAHMRAAHSGSGSASQPYRCEKCNREFSQFNNLRRHMRVHREKTYKCHLCDRVFNEEFYLKMHVGTHTGQRVYSCGVCNAPFQSNQELKTHVKTHSPSQLHNCNICGKSFSKACVLRQHKKTHSGERPHHCMSCGKTFIHRHHLTMHMRSHAENKPFTCDLCSKEFSQTSHLYKHLRQHEEENLEISRNGVSNESNAIQKRKHKSHDNSPCSNTQKGLKKSKKENLENMDPNDVKGRTQKRINEARTLQKSNIAMNYHSEATLQERNRNHQEINGNIGQNFSHQILGTDTEKNKDTNATKRSIDFALNDLEKSKSKILKKLQQNTGKDRAPSQTTTQPFSHPDVQTAKSLPGFSFGASLSSVSSAPGKLPSFNSITSGLKESYPKWPATNTPTSMPYYQTPSYEQTLYPYGYPSMGYGSSSMYLAYSAQMQAYYNMLYYNSKALINDQYQSSENGNIIHSTSVVNEQMSKEVETSKVELVKGGLYSENNNTYNNAWYYRPELVSTINNGETKAVVKNVDASNNQGMDTKMGEKSVKKNNTLLIAALKEGASTETDIRSDTHTNEHILKIMKLKDRLIEETSNETVNSQLSESKGRNQICSIEAGQNDTNEKPSVDEIQVDQVNVAAVDHETNIHEFERYQNIELSNKSMNSELGESKEMATYHMNQGMKIEEVDKKGMSECGIEDQNLKTADESISVVNNRMAESTTVKSENDHQENNQMQNDRNKEFEHSEYFICCDTCSFTFSGKDDLKKHFIENPVCFSKVCQTSKISEEFGWQLLDYYLASLEMHKSNKTDNETSNEINSLGDAKIGTVQQTTEVLVQQNVEVYVDSSLSSESNKPSDPALFGDDNSEVMNDNKNIAGNEKQNLINIAQDNHSEIVANESSTADEVEKPRDVVNLADVSEKLSDDKCFQENNYPCSINKLTDKEVCLSKRISDDSEKNQSIQQSTTGLKETIHLAEEKSFLPVSEAMNDTKLSVENKGDAKESQTDEKLTFNCQFCEADFEDQKTLDSHILTHPTDKPFTCTQCSRNFTHKHNLKRHLMSHSDRCVECHVCKRTFKEKYYLQMHMKVHLEPDARQCEICGELVATADSSNHVKGHIGPIEENPTYIQIGGRVQEILKENAEIENENVKSDVLDLSNKPVSKEILMKMSVEQLKSLMMKGKTNLVNK